MALNPADLRCTNYITLMEEEEGGGGRRVSFRMIQLRKGAEMGACGVRGGKGVGGWLGMEGVEGWRPWSNSNTVCVGEA